jgi:hypothetical protein
MGSASADSRSRRRKPTVRRESVGSDLRRMRTRVVRKDPHRARGAKIQSRCDGAAIHLHGDERLQQRANPGSPAAHDRRDAPCLRYRVQIPTTRSRGRQFFATAQCSAPSSGSPQYCTDHSGKRSASDLAGQLADGFCVAARAVSFVKQPLRQLASRHSIFTWHDAHTHLRLQSVTDRGNFVADQFDLELIGHRCVIPKPLDKL